jgi:hypothetical protein
LIPTCCNCKLVDGEEPHPSNYQGCSQTREEMRKRKLQRATKSISGRVFSSNQTTPGLSLAAALHRNTQHQQQPHLPMVVQACAATVGEMSAPPPLRHNQQVPSQSVQAPNVNNSFLNEMFKVVATVFQQIMTEINGFIGPSKLSHSMRMA